MAETPFNNIYDLSTSQLERLDEAEDLMLKNDLGAAERLLLSMLDGHSSSLGGRSDRNNKVSEKMVDAKFV